MDETQNQPLVPATLPKSDVEQNKDIAALSYAWVLSVVVLLWKRDSSFAQFHAKQATVLFALSVVVWPIPFVGQFLELLILGLCVFGFLAAAQGEQKYIPIIGDIAFGQLKNLRHSWHQILQFLLRGWHKVRRSAKKNETKSEASSPSTTPEPSQPPILPVPSLPSEPSQPDPLNLPNLPPSP